MTVSVLHATYQSDRLDVLFIMPVFKHDRPPTHCRGATDQSKSPQGVSILHPPDQPPSARRGNGLPRQKEPSTGGLSTTT